MVVVSESMLPQIRGVVRPVSALPGFSVGADPEMPSLAPIAAVEKVLLQQMVAPDELVAVEVMEAFAVQAMVCIDACGFDRAVVNRGVEPWRGGILSGLLGRFWQCGCGGNYSGKLLEGMDWRLLRRLEDWGRLCCGGWFNCNLM